MCIAFLVMDSVAAGAENRRNCALSARGDPIAVVADEVFYASLAP